MSLGKSYKKLGLGKRHLLLALTPFLFIALVLTSMVSKNSQRTIAEQGAKGPKSSTISQANFTNLPLASGDLSAPKEKTTPEVNFSEVGSPASVEVKSENQSIKFTVLQSDQTANTEDQVSSTPQTPATAEEITKKDDQTTIRVNNNLDLEYKVSQNPSATIVKETAIIKDASSLSADPNYHLAFKMDLNGLDPVKNQDGSYSLKDKNGITSMSISAPTIEDSEKKIGQISLNIDKDNSLATFVIDPAFIDSAKFPLYLDPTVTIATSTTTNPNSFSKDRTLFEATNGDMISIYSAGAEVDYKISTDKGNTWGSATKIIDSSTADDTGFSGWITADNKIHFTYSNNNTNGID